MKQNKKGTTKMKNEENFETKLKNLESIVYELEKGDLSLEESLKKFEEGIKTSKECNKFLEDAEKKITIILQENGEISEEPLSVDN